MNKNKFIKFYVDEDNKLQLEIMESDQYTIDYQTLRNAVGNSLDIVSYVDFGKDNIVAYVDDEGLIKKQKPTFWLIDDSESKIRKYPLVGNIVIVKEENLLGDGLQSVCLTDDEINLVCSKILTDGLDHYFLHLNTIELERRREFYHHLQDLNGFEIVEVTQPLYIDKTLNNVGNKDIKDFYEKLINDSFEENDKDKPI